MHQNHFPDRAGGAYSAPPDSLAGLKGPTSKGRGGDMGRKGKTGEGEGREGRGRRGRDGKGGHPQYFIAPPVPVF